MLADPVTPSHAHTPPSLPPLRAPWPDPELPGALYAGVITAPDGAPYALVLLDDKPDARLNWDNAMAWATGIGADLPTRPESAMLFANLPDAFEKNWHWTNEQYSPDCSWLQVFANGDQDFTGKGYEARARAVRRFKLSA